MKKLITAISLLAATLGATAALAGDKSTGTRGGGSFSITADGQVLWVDHPGVRGASFGVPDPLAALGQKITKDLKRAEHLLEAYGVKGEFFQKYIYNPNIGYYFASTADFRKEAAQDCPDEYSNPAPAAGTTNIPGGCTKGNTTTFDWNAFQLMDEQDVPPNRNYGAVRALFHEALHRVPGEHSAILWNIVSDGLAELLELHDQQQVGGRRVITDGEVTVLSGLLHALRQFEIGGLDDSYEVANGGGIVAASDKVGQSAFIGAGSKVYPGVQVDDGVEVVDSWIASNGLEIQSGTRLRGSKIICSATDLCRDGGVISESTIDHSVISQYRGVDIRGAEIRESTIAVGTAVISGKPENRIVADDQDDQYENDKGTAVFRSSIDSVNLKMGSAVIRDSHFSSNENVGDELTADDEIADGVSIRFSDLSGRGVRVEKGARLLGTGRPANQDSRSNTRVSISLTAYGPIAIGNEARLSGDIFLGAFGAISIGNQATLSDADLQQVGSVNLAEGASLEDVIFNRGQARWTLGSTEDSVVLERGAHVRHIADTPLWGKRSKSPSLIVPADVTIDNGSRPICPDKNMGMVLRGKMVFRDVAEMAKTCNVNPNTD